MRRRFFLLAVFTLLVAGMSIWRVGFGVRPGAAPGTVAGARVAAANAWAGKVPFVRLLPFNDERQRNGGKLFFWDALNGANELSVVGGLSVSAVAITKNGRDALIAAADGAQTVFWLYHESEEPEFLTAVQGIVTQMHFAPNGRFASILLLRPSAAVPEVDLLDTVTKRLSRVFPAALHAVWLTRTLGLVGVSPDGTLSYAILRSGGTADVVVLPAVALSTVAVQPASDLLYFVHAAEGRHVLAAYDLVQRAQSVIAQLTEAADQYQVALNPAGTELAVRPAGTATPLSIVTLASGSMTALHVLSGPVVWVNDTQLLVEQPAAGTTVLALLSGKEQKMRTVVAEGDNRLSL